MASSSAIAASMSSMSNHTCRAIRPSSSRPTTWSISSWGAPGLESAVPPPDALEPDVRLGPRRTHDGTAPCPLESSAASREATDSPACGSSRSRRSSDDSRRRPRGANSCSTSSQASRLTAATMRSPTRVHSLTSSAPGRFGGQVPVNLRGRPYRGRCAPSPQVPQHLSVHTGRPPARRLLALPAASPAALKTVASARQASP